MKHIENSQKEVEDTVNNLNIGIMMTNYYFDTGDYSSPVKVDLSNDNEYSTLNNFKRIVRIKVKQNIVSDTTNYFPFASSNQLTYFSIGESARDLDYSPNDNTIFQLIIVMDSKYNKIKIYL